jgi:hypothetical protein
VHEFPEVWKRRVVQRVGYVWGRPTMYVKTPSRSEGHIAYFSDLMYAHGGQLLGFEIL